MDNLKFPESSILYKCPKKINTIFLTGGTGFLGSHILKNLINSFKNTIIYCLVRNKSNLLIHERVKPIIGDLNLYNLGIEEFEKISNEINIIIHWSFIGMVMPIKNYIYPILFK